VHPDRAIRRKELTNLSEPITHHRQPDGVLKGVVVVQEALLGIERRVEVRELDLAQVLARELGKARQTPQGVQRVAADEQVVSRTRTADLTDGGQIVEEADLGNPVVRRRHLLITTVLMGEQPERLVRPRQLKSTLVGTQREPFSSQSRTHSSWSAPPSGYRAANPHAWRLPGV
jgi:hypothetical protein